MPAPSGLGPPTSSCRRCSDKPLPTSPGPRSNSTTADGAAGAARGAGIGVGHFSDSSDAFSGLSRQAVIEPIPANQAASAELLTTWQASLTHAMARLEH